uniref:Uncharacterized protein n=1 Tax=Anguilla anguilla TaxID=7936 RepID=A0A0E9WN67_ANGAN
MFAHDPAGDMPFTRLLGCFLMQINMNGHAQLIYEQLAFILSYILDTDKMEGLCTCHASHAGFS